MTTLDVLIHSGLIVDGTGNPGYFGALGVVNGRIKILRGDVSIVDANDRVDATGMIVAPGFIDIHSHSDLQMMVEPTLDAKVRQGITTEVIGVDGLSYAPFQSSGDLREFVESYAGINGSPAIDLPSGSVGELLDRYDGSVSPNVAMLVGNSALRIAAMGWRADPASSEDIATMRDMLRSAMEEGAIGLSTGLDYAPGSHASTEELIDLAAEAADAGGIYHTHVRYEHGDRYLDPFEEAMRIGRESGCPIHITHFSRSSRGPYRRGAQSLLDRVEQEVDAGYDVTFDTYMSQWGGTRLARLLPKWVDAGGRTKLLEQLDDPVTRGRVKAEIEKGTAYTAYVISRPFADIRIGNLSDGNHVGFEGRFLSEVAVDLGASVADTVIDLVLTNPGATFTRPSPDLATLWKFVVHPLGMIASDAVLIGRAPSPRAFGCFPQVLDDIVREERMLTIQEAIRKMTSFPAQRIGLMDRGVLRDGFAADIVVFDPQATKARSTYEEPRELATGIPHVIVNGVFAVRDNVSTGLTPGRALR